MVSLSTTTCFLYENKNLVKFLFLVMMAKEKPPITVVGDVGGRIAIIVVRYTFLSICYTTENKVNFSVGYCSSFYMTNAEVKTLKIYTAELPVY